MAQRKYTLVSKIGYGSIDILGGGAFALIGLLFLFFLMTMEGMSGALAGAVLLVGRVWDAIIDPLLGAISDKTRSRFGRRRVYILAGVAPVIVTFSLLWYSFGITGDITKFLYYTVMYILFSTAFSIVMVPYNALLPDMIDGYKARAGYVSVRMFISMLAATVSVMVPGIILGAEADRTLHGYLVMGIIFGLFYGLPLLFGFFTTWENPTPEAEAVPSLGEMLRRTARSFKNKAYRQYLGIFCWGQMATDLITAMAVFWLVDNLQMQGMTTIFAGLLMLVGAAMLPAYNWIAGKYGKHVPSYVCMPFRIVALIIGFFMGPEIGLVGLVIVCVVMGIGHGASNFVPWCLLPDIPDSDEMINGTRDAGIFGGMATLVRQSTGGVALFLGGVALELFGYIESEAGEVVEQTATALLGIRVMFAAVPAVLSLIVVWLGFRYVLTKNNHAAILQAVAHKREHGSPTDDPELIAACEKVAGKSFNKLWVGTM